MMHEVIDELVSPKSVRKRNGGESGFTEDLISTVATIYCKIAQMHGYEMDVNSPYVVTQWLSMEPIEHYDKKYDFLV
jgi:hypothetical protein